MNAKLLRNLVDRHAPTEVKETLRELDTLAERRKILTQQMRDKEFELLHGPRQKPGCPVCGRPSLRSFHNERRTLLCLPEPTTRPGCRRLQ